MGHLRVAMSHAQLNRIDCWELAHRQAYSRSDVYGECRDSEQACLRACRHGESESVGMAKANLSARRKRICRHGEGESVGMAKAVYLLVDANCVSI